MTSGAIKAETAEGSDYTNSAGADHSTTSCLFLPSDTLFLPASQPLPAEGIPIDSLSGQQN